MAGSDHLFEPMEPVTGPDRELLFCVASATEWERTDIMDAAVTSMVERGLLQPDGRGRLDLTRQGDEMLCLLLGREYYTEDIGGGLLAWIEDRTDAPWKILIPGNGILHWNISVPGGSGSQYSAHPADILEAVEAGTAALATASAKRITAGVPASSSMNDESVDV
jgi:hypothetical protein